MRWSPATTSSRRSSAASPPWSRTTATKSAVAEQVSLDQQLGDLNRVGGSALAQVVADDPEVEAAVGARIAADPPDQHLVAAGGIGRHRIEAVGWVVDDHHAGRGGED